MLRISVENGAPTPGELGEGPVDQVGRTLRPGIDVGLGERAGKADGDGKPEIAAGAGGEAKLARRPFNSSHYSTLEAAVARSNRRISQVGTWMPR